MSLLRARRVRAATAFLWFEGCWSLFHAVAFTLLLVYQVQTAHLNPFQLIVVGTVMEATCFLAEVPTGVVADLYSRRLSVLIGAFAVGFGILIQGAFPSFWPIVAGNVVWGVGYAFISGALVAWITDEVGPDRVQPLFTRAEQQHLALTVVGAILAGLLALIDMRLPMLLAGLAYVGLAIVMSRLMPETGFAPTPRAERETYAHMRQILLDGVSAARRPGVVRSFLIVALLAGIASEVFDRLWVAHLLTEFAIADAALWFTAFALIGNLVALLASVVANRIATDRINQRHPTGLMAGLLLVQAAGVAGFAVLDSLWPALIAMWLGGAARSIAGPIGQAWLNRNVAARSRATTLSLTSQADAIGQVAGGPPLGLLATRTAIPVALLVSAGFLLPAAAVYARLRPNRQEAATL